MKKWMILLLTVLLLLGAAACGKGQNSPGSNGGDASSDPNAALTDSDVPLELGAELQDFGTTQVGEVF